MANKKNKEAFNKMKFEVANELGIDLKEGYNGDKTSRENGAIGGRITQKVFEEYTGSSKYNKNSNK
jgi:hypothetical protein